ncbi:MAG: flippase-like domain-containing protein [Arenicella sp.]|nr:flippase-like domain-containing protein [Arenicella sp.]
MSKQLFTYLRIAITLCLLGVVFYLADLFSPDGRKLLFDTLKNADLVLLVAAILIGVLINMVSAFKWYMLTRARALGASYWRIFAYYLIGQFYNMFLPTSVGGDFVRSYELGKFSGRQADALASVFVERYTGVVTLLAVATLAVMTQLTRFNQSFIIVTLITFGLGLGFIAWLVFDSRIYPAVRDFIQARLSLSSKIFSKLNKLLEAITVYKQQPATIALALLNSLLFYFVAVVNVYLTAMVFNSEVSFLDMLIATPIIMLIMNLPISIGNIGLMEVGYVSVLELLGYGAELGIAIMLLMRFKSLFDAALGGVLHPVFVTKKIE